MKRNKITITAVLLTLALALVYGKQEAIGATVLTESSSSNDAVTTLVPENKSSEINPDTHLDITFTSQPSIGTKGCIKIYDRETGAQVDCLDMSIPSGPTMGQPTNPNAIYTPQPYNYDKKKLTNLTAVPGTPSGVNKRDTSRYQLNIIGGFTDAFHFHPVIIHGLCATIYPHNNILQYGHQYFVTIDNGAITTADGEFHGIQGKNGWTFTTKAEQPSSPDHFLMVSATGDGDFNTLQGALDYIPDMISDSTQAWNIWIQNGDYEEIVYCRNKQYINIEGESQDSVIIHYPNNEVFNPHPSDIKTNEMPGTFPSRRAAVSIDNCRFISLRNLTLKTDLKGQAEGLLINGDSNIVDSVKIIGSGDALQVNGSTYFCNCIINGDGDTILGRGPSFFDHCTLTSYGAFMWIRNTEHNHGNVFLNCTFHALDKDAVIARSPINKGKGYPYAEAVLIHCTLDNVPAVGWGPIEGDTTNVKFMEYDSRNPDGTPVDVSQRHHVSRQLDAQRDSKIIADYSDRDYVLGNR